MFGLYEPKFKDLKNFTDTSEGNFDLYITEISLSGNLEVRDAYNALGSIFELPDWELLKKGDIPALEEYIKQGYTPNISKQIGYRIYDIYTYTSHRRITLNFETDRYYLTIDFPESRRAAYDVLCHYSDTFTDPHKRFPHIYIKYMAMPVPIDGNDSAQYHFRDSVMDRESLQKVIDEMGIHSDVAWREDGHCFSEE